MSEISYLQTGKTPPGLREGYGAAEKENTKADFIAPDILAAVKKILSLDS